MLILKGTSVFEKIVEIVEKGLNSMFTEYPVILYQLLATFIIFIVIKKFLWGKLTKYLDDQRYKMIKQRLESDKIRDEALALKDEVKAEYQQIKQETRELREKLHKEAVLEKEQIIEEAKKEAKARLDRVEQEISQEIKQNEEKIKQSIKDIAYVAAEKILKKELDRNKYNDIIEDVTNIMQEKGVNETD